jgi:hypothetical protein
MKAKKLVVKGVPLFVFFTLLAGNIFLLVVFIFLTFVKEDLCPVHEPNKLILYSELAICSFALIFSYTVFPRKKKESSSIKHKK